VGLLLGNFKWLQIFLQVKMSALASEKVTNIFTGKNERISFREGYRNIFTGKNERISFREGYKYFYR
jgi:hypothetical protein